MAKTVRLIDAESNALGVVSLADALQRAEDEGLDLVEMSGEVVPPVCKLIDYGKHCYRQQKKRSESRRKQKVMDVKEVKMRPGIEAHDYDFKMKALKKFLAKGDKVRVSLRFRGREMEYQQRGIDLLNKVEAETKNIARVEQSPKLEGRLMVMILAPQS